MPQFCKLIENLDDTNLGLTPTLTLTLTQVPQFCKLIENLDDTNLGRIRAILPGMVEHPPGKEALLVFDDGKQQMWRLVPGGRTLVRKPVTTEARGMLTGR